MKKRWMLASVAFIVGSLMMLGPTAFASKQTFWIGHVGKSQNNLVLFMTKTIDGVVNFEPLEIDFKVKCHVSGQVWGFGASFSGFQEPLDENGNFDLDLGDPYFGPFDWKGNINGTSASGTVLAGFAEYDGQGGFGTESCDNDPGASWKAHALSGGVPSLPGSPQGSVHVSFTKDQNGQVHVSVGR
jgi:hypothetical protein